MASLFSSTFALFSVLTPPDANRKPQRVALCTNKEAARQMLGRLETDARLAERGMLGGYEKHLKRPLLEHVDDFEYGNTCEPSTPGRI
jgi:hypothetical protein